MHTTHEPGRPHPIRNAALAAVLTLFTASVGWAALNGPAAAATSDTGCAASTAQDIPQPSRAQLVAAGLGDLTLAPDSARRDLSVAAFSDSTSVTNPLFPVSDLRSAILNGHVDGKVFHTETTLLPFTQIIEWTPGQCVRVLESQYMAFLGGRLQETAIDLYAQADDGSVWYLGESVFDYDTSGLVVTTEGTWHAGTEGPLAMIMPSNPQVDDAHRAENIPGTVFEEVQISKINQTFQGPSGPVSGGIVGVETHRDGSLSDKLFAPGYGEFRSTDGTDLEAMALASPIDALPGGVPAELSTVSRGADRIFSSPLATPAQWARADTIARGMVRAWQTFRAGDVPPRLVKPTERALQDLATRIATRDRSKTRGASVAAAYTSNDLQLRYRDPAAIDTVRFELWTRRALVDAAAGSLGGVRSDVVTLEWIRDRIAHTLESVTLTRVDALIGDLGTAVFDRDLGAASRAAAELRGVIRPLI